MVMTMITVVMTTNVIQDDGDHGVADICVGDDIVGFVMEPYM